MAFDPDQGPQMLELLAMILPDQALSKASHAM
jgi:hypothetical protein